MAEQLTVADVARLLANPSPDTRADMAAKVASQLDQQILSPSERLIAEEIVRIMAQDAVVRVRQSLAENLKASKSLPHDVAVRLARDVEAVALPVLAFSQVLVDEDLIEVIRQGAAGKQAVIAGRPDVSPEVADELVDNGDESVVAALVANVGAKIADGSLEKVVERFGDSPTVQAPLVHRAKLPITVAERLVALVSENLQKYLVAHHDLPPAVASDIILRSRERATHTLFTGESDDAVVEDLVSHLYRAGRLSPSLLVRAVFMADVGFFEAGVSRLAGVPLPNTRLLIHDGGGLGLKSIWDRAELPPQLLPAVRVALDVLHETAFDGEDHDEERHRRRVLERILTQYDDLPAADLDYLLEKFSDLIHQAT